MLLLILAIILIIIGIIFIKTDSYDNDNASCGFTFLLLGGIPLFIMMIFIAMKPLDYRELKIRYDTIKETITEKDDIRDATFTTKIIEINQEINTCRELKDSKWIGIFQNKKICKMKLLKKEVE